MYGLVRAQDGVVHRILSPENTIQVGVVACLDWYTHDVERAKKMEHVVENYRGRSIFGGAVSVQDANTVTCLWCTLAALSTP